MKVTTEELYALLLERNEPRKPMDRDNPYRSTRDVALVIGGGSDPLTEYECALAMCEMAGKSVEVLACNDSIPRVRGVLHHAVTLHPEKLPGWFKMRRDAGQPEPERIWAHRPYVGVTNWTRDWHGSSGLLCAKIAREIGMTHIILCGVPMTVEDQHFVRRVRWTSADGFKRGWTARVPKLRPFVRSMSGWTRDQFGEPTDEWLAEAIPDPTPVYPEPCNVKA